jgi:DNA repair protein SbcC/Rad50
MIAPFRAFLHCTSLYFPMSLLSSFKSLFGGKAAEPTVTPLSTQAQSEAKQLVKTQTQAVDTAKEQTTLDALLASPNNVALIAFAAKSNNAAQRWQAVQAVSAAGWPSIQAQVAPRDRRIAKWVKEQLAAQKAVLARDASWADLATGYASLLQSPSVDVRHFVELDKSFDTAQQLHGFDAQIQTQVAGWRNTLQARLQSQNDAQRAAQALRDSLKSVLDSAQRGHYSDELQAQLDTAITAHDALPHAHGLLPIQRLHIEIKALIPETISALSTAAQGTSRLEAAEALVLRAQQYARQSPATLEGAGIGELKKAWRSDYSPFVAQKTTFDAALAQASTALDAYKAALADRHEQNMAWLTSTQAQLAAALEAGQGQEAVRLASEINDKAGKQFDLARVPNEQAAALDRLLSQARETRGLLWEGAALEREAILAKAQALAAKPLVGKFQEQALKEVTDAWKAVNAKAGGAPSALFMQFKAACDEAYAPVKAHKTAMRQVNSVGNEQRQNLLNELTAIQASIDWATVDWSGVEALRNESRKQWRECLPSDYKQREALTAGFDGVMAVFETKLGEARETELARRTRLTQAALALEGKPFPEQHNGVRNLMERYNAERSSVYMPRELDQAAWAQFRAAIDGVYARRDVERKAELAENAQAITDLITAKQAVLAQLKADVELTELKPLQTAITKAQLAWDEPGRLPRGVGEHSGVNIDALVKDWLASLEAAQAKALGLQAMVQKTRIALAMDLAHALDAGTDITALWESASKDAALKKAFAPRVNSVLSGTPLMTGGSLATVLLDAEIASQTDSPAAHKDARLKLQVQRLSDKLTGNKQHSADAGFNAWLTALALPGASQGEAGERIAAISQRLS